MNLLSEQVRRELAALGSATVYEASQLDCYLDPAFRPAWPGATIVGSALPISAGDADNLPVHWGLAMAQPGEVLVVDAGGSKCGYLGEVMAVAALTRGIAGIVIDGGVRDTRELENLGFPAFSTSIAIRGTGKRDAGTVGPDVHLRGRQVRRGDVVVADRDGIAIVPAEQFQRTLTEARRRMADERQYMARLRTGEQTLDVYGLRALGTPITTGGGTQ